MSTIPTFKESRMSNSIPIMASITFLGCVGRINIDNSTTFFKSFIFDKVLKLSKRPLVNPFIISSRDSNSTQIFHNNNISLIQTGNNRKTDVMVSPTHKPRPFAREFFEFSLGTSGAFALEFTNKFISLYPQGFNFVTIKNIFGSDCEIINSQVHPKNFRMLVRSFGAFLRECEGEIGFIFLSVEQTFNNFPIIKIFSCIFRNINRNFNSTLDGRDTQNIMFERETSRSIISDRSSINQRFSFSLFNNPTSHLNTRSRELSRKSKFSQFRINKGMEFNIITNSQSPSIFNTILKSLLIQVKSINYAIINFNFNRNTSNQHCKDSSNSDYLNVSEGSIPPTSEEVGFLEQVLI